MYNDRKTDVCNSHSNYKTPVAVVYYRVFHDFSKNISK